MTPVSSNYPPGMVLVPTGEISRYTKFHAHLSDLEVPIGSVTCWKSSPLVKKNIDAGFMDFRNNPVLQWVWIIGDDNTFLPDIVLKLLAREKPCVVPLCFNRIPPIGTTLCRQDSGKPTVLTAEAGLYKLSPTETCGDAGMLISRAAVEASGPPWQDEPYCGTWNVEDQRFVRKLQEREIEVYYDFDNALGHITPVELVPYKGPTSGQWRVLLKSGGRKLCFLQTP